MGIWPVVPIYVLIKEIEDKRKSNIPEQYKARKKRMKQNVMNPYLPLYEYIPDAEPRVFGDRLYVYGSHDYAGGEKNYCPGDYMVWSTPLSDLSQWRCDGIGFKRSDCPNLEETDAMAAPDVIQGVDQRYYMYWNTNGTKVCHVAVSDTPEGPFSFYADVQWEDGTPYEDYKMFDPGVLVDDDKRVYLYTGFCMNGPVPEKYKGFPSPFADTSLGFELAADMKTIVAGPTPIIPGWSETKGTGFEGHGFYEASSPRKINGKYVMVYSGERSHDLAYAIASEPLGKYEYAGVLISNADLGLEGNTEPIMPYGNNHGGLVEINHEWYIFYHRQTHAIECSRQGCAEKLERREDGWFKQVEITSCGLSEDALQTIGTYNACYCCYLRSSNILEKRLEPQTHRRDTEPYIFEEAVGDNETNALHYIANIQKETVIGFKYFIWSKPEKLKLKLSGHGKCKVKVHIDAPNGEIIGALDIELSDIWKDYDIPVQSVSKRHALYFEFQTNGVLQFMEFSFE